MSDAVLYRNTRWGVVGLGTTGLSCVRFLRQHGYPVSVLDTRMQPPGMEECSRLWPEVEIHRGPLTAEHLSQCDQLRVSPGVSVYEPALQEWKNERPGRQLVGDIELFAMHAKAPVVAITGSNAKSTVTTLVGEMAVASGLNTQIGGNLGKPALDLLDDRCELYVLELSSFQLETTFSLKPEVATILNMSEDHLDRYASMAEYHAAKQRIYRHCHKIVFNRQDPLTQPLIHQEMLVQSFGKDEPDLGQWGLVQRDGDLWLCQGRDLWLNVREMKIRGLHNSLNALAALALGTSVGLDKEAMLGVLRCFAGLEHRCKWIREHEGVRYYDDSKGTNVGATLAALEGLGFEAPVVVILGGIGKGQNFRPLHAALKQFARAVVLMGVDAPLIAASVPEEVPFVFASTMSDAVAQARQLAKSGDAVLLSPACSSFDMFRDYHDRGQQFIQCVEDLQ